MLRHFFATADDLLPVLEHIDFKRSLTYTLTGLFKSPLISAVAKGVDIPTLREPAKEPNAINCPSYLVTPLDVAVQVREVPQKSGRMLYAFDQLINPDSITLSHGGFFSPELLLYGRVGTVSDSATAKALYRVFANAIAKQFVGIRAFWVGPGAAELLHQGCRLTAGAHCPKRSDLAL
jgi:hypothetical protein